MKSKRSDLEVRYNLLFKLDAYNLYQRVSVRQFDYIEAFSLKRNRAVFKDIFDNRYKNESIKDLSHCSVEVIESLNSFYTLVDEIYWYLKHTQDMPNMIQDEVQRYCNRLRGQYETLALFVDAELTGEETFSVDFANEIEPAPDDKDNDFFKLEGEDALVAAESEYIQDEEYIDEDFEDDNDTSGQQDLS